MIGFSEGLRRYGSLLEYLDLAFVNGFFYYCPGRSPPRELSVIRRARCGRSSQQATRHSSSPGDESATVFEHKLWREDLERWDREVKQGGDSRSPRAAGRRSERARDRRSPRLPRPMSGEPETSSAFIHHLFNVPALVPIEDFLVHARVDGTARGELLSLLQGVNPDPLRR